MLGGGADELVEGRLGPDDLAGRGFDALDPLDLDRVVAGLGETAGVLDEVLGGLDDDLAARVVARATGPAGDLVELAGLEDALLGAVELRKLGEEDSADRDVDTDAEGVGATDDLEQSGLRELLDRAAVAGEHAGVVHPDPLAQQAIERLAEAGREADGGQPVGDRDLLLRSEELHRVEGLGVLGGRGLARVDDIDRGPVGADDLLEGVSEGVDRPGERQGDGPLGGDDEGDVPAGPLGEVVADPGHVSEGRGHEDELGVGELEQGDLPGPTALRIGVVVELVHDHQARVGRRALSQSDVGEDLGCAADDRGIGVDARVAGEQADLVGAKDVAQGEELLVDEGLDRSGVEAHAVAGEGREVGGGGHE